LRAVARNHTLALREHHVDLELIPIRERTLKADCGSSRPSRLAGIGPHRAHDDFRHSAPKSRHVDGRGFAVCEHERGLRPRVGFCCFAVLLVLAHGTQWWPCLLTGENRSGSCSVSCAPPRRDRSVAMLQHVNATLTSTPPQILNFVRRAQTPATGAFDLCPGRAWCEISPGSASSKTASGSIAGGQDQTCRRKMRIDFDSW
jgi:hypothetical protein